MILAQTVLRSCNYLIFKRGLHVAFLTKGGRVYHVRESQPGVWRGKPSKHAECAVLQSLKSNIKTHKYVFWSLRFTVTKNGNIQLTMAKPCRNCAIEIRKQALDGCAIRILMKYSKNYNQKTYT